MFMIERRRIRLADGKRIRVYFGTVKENVDVALDRETGIYYKSRVKKSAFPGALYVAEIEDIRDVAANAATISITDLDEPGSSPPVILTGEIDSSYLIYPGFVFGYRIIPDELKIDGIYELTVEGALLFDDSKPLEKQSNNITSQYLKNKL